MNDRTVGVGAMGPDIVRTPRQRSCELGRDARAGTGHAHEDDSAVIKIFPGIRLPGPAGEEGE